METLLDKAKRIKSGKNGSRNYTKQHYELALAYLKGEITLSQAAYVLEIKGQSRGNANYHISKIIGCGVRSGEIDVTIK